MHTCVYANLGECALLDSFRPHYFFSISVKTSSWRTRAGEIFDLRQGWTDGRAFLPPPNIICHSGSTTAAIMCTTYTYALGCM